MKDALSFVGLAAAGAACVNTIMVFEPFPMLVGVVGLAACVVTMIGLSRRWP
jgi:hypothetical protein